MITPEEIQRINEVLAQNALNAKKYAEARQNAARAKYNLDVLVGAKYLSEELNVKAAYEKALILIASESEENKKLYQDYLRYRSIYKGLEKVIEANSSMVMWAQSKMKYIVENT